MKRALEKEYALENPIILKNQQNENNFHFESNSNIHGHVKKLPSINSFFKKKNRY